MIYNPNGATESRLKDQHPLWSDIAVSMVAAYRPRVDQMIQLEYLMELYCSHCGLQIGEHVWFEHSWKCPKQ